MGSRTARQFQVGDTVRFPKGSIDWVVAKAIPHNLHPSVQSLTLVSGMSDRQLQTSNQRVVSRDEALAGQAGTRK